MSQTSTNKIQNSFFFTNLGVNDPRLTSINEISEYLESNKKQSYFLSTPLVDKSYNYQYEFGAILLIPQEKIIFINFGTGEDPFNDFCDDFIEDIGYISKKYEYQNFLGRPKQWRETNTIRVFIDDIKSIENFKSFIQNNQIDKKAQRECDLIISLIIGSINDIKIIKEELPNNQLDIIKQKIVLFDTDQTRFIYEDMEDRSVITIQGLSGTGKTELLLHKLKELYTIDDKSKILLTCHNKILAEKLRRRIPLFFNFMKVDSQIDWDNRLKCVHAWGSTSLIDSGAYRFICYHYQIPFETFSYQNSFNHVCKNALKLIKESPIQEKPFDYILIDESQDFPDSFFDLCIAASNKKVFIAGDIFQSIFDNPEKQISKADFLLNKCYRTDPKTLMFGHAFGMKLFEDPKLRWLEDAEWNACGYQIRKDIQQNQQFYHLSREPLRRFEEIQDLESIILDSCIFDIPNLTAKVKTIIKSLRQDYPTVRPDDIAIIIMPDKNMGDLLYSFAQSLEFSISLDKEIQWKVNTAYSTKQTIDDHIFLTNTNNVKGLEFPFVICISKKIKDSYSYRNSMYMATTRSFLKTFLIIDSVSNTTENLKPIVEGLEKINLRKEIITKEPNPDEKDQIKTKLQKISKQESIQNYIISVYDELSIPNDMRKIINDIIKTLVQNGIKDKEKIRSLIESNYKSLCN